MEQTFQATVDDRGRIKLPARIRERLRLNPGMTLVVEMDEEGAVRLNPQTAETILVDKGGILVIRAAPLADLEAAVEEAREARLAVLLEQFGA